MSITEVDHIHLNAVAVPTAQKKLTVIRIGATDVYREHVLAYHKPKIEGHVVVPGP